MGVPNPVLMGVPNPTESSLGDHVILNIDISTPIEDEKAARPKDAELFTGPLRTD